MIKELNKTIEKIEGLHAESTKVTIYFTDGTNISQYHEQDCCEHVEVTQVDGNVERHHGAETWYIEEKVSTDYPDCLESCTAYFYTLKTSKGYLDWRWVGESNGYYSESVEMEYNGEFVEL